MNMTVVSLVSVLAVWMLVCGWCGYRKRIFVFMAVLGAGLALNMAWMVLSLNARPFDAYALMAELSVLIYGIGAFGVGWMINRLVRQFQKTRIE